ncbi:MAG: hypothetical protein VX834_00895 [Myxococcota bacterium]|nr:hypothetical protein [Myxococcota bacterium]
MRRTYLAVLMSGLLLSPSLYAQDSDPAPAEPEVAPSTTEEVVEKPAAPAEAPAKAVTEVEATAEATVVEGEEAASEDEAPKKPWSVSLGLSHSAGSATFVQTQGDYQDSFGYVGQNWSLGAGYGFELFGQKLRAGLGFSTNVTLTRPQSNPARRINPSDTSLSLSAGSLYKDELTGINLSGGLSMSLPTSYASRNGRAKYAGFSARMGLSRSFGGLSLSYGLSAGHTLYDSKVASNYTQVVSEINSANCSAIGDENLFRCQAGYANPYLGLNNSLSVGYSITDAVSLSYSLSFSQAWKYAVASEGDEFTLEQSGSFLDADGNIVEGNPASDTGAGRSQSFSTGLSVSYALSKSLKNVLDLPFNLSMSAGVSSSHNAQRWDNEQGKRIVYLPLLVNGWGDQAANGYGSVYLSLNGSY